MEQGIAKQVTFLHAIAQQRFVKTNNLISFYKRNGLRA